MRLLKKNIPLDNHKEIFYNLVAERNGKVEKLHNPVNSQNLMYHDVSLILKLFLMIYSLKIEKFEVVEKIQIEFESKFSSVTIGGNKLDKQLCEIENITKFYKLPEEVIKFYNDYSKMVNKAPFDAKYGKELKILIPTQMLQRLPIALAQVKADNASENLLNKIRQIIYSLFQEKKFLKSIQQYNEFNKVIKQKEYYIYEFWEQ